MNPGVATADRLVAAIEKFFTVEGLWLKSGNCVQAAAVSRRVAPLVARLGELGASDRSVRAAIAPKVVKLISVRRDNQALLAAQKARLVAERRRLAEARGHLSNMAPVYGARLRSSGVRKRLNAAV